MDRIPVLVVEDSPANLRLVTYLLEAKGFDVRGAPDADTALEILKEFRPRLILMDLQLPRRDGYDLTRALKADARTKDIVVVALTAYAMKGDEARARKAGCDGYITKPINVRALSGLLLAHLGMSESAPRSAAS
jgi:CheY-like chemotaxis protein